MKKIEAIIRKSKNVDEARTSLIDRFKLSEIQANAILDEISSPSSGASICESAFLPDKLLPFYRMAIRILQVGVDCVLQRLFVKSSNTCTGFDKTLMSWPIAVSASTS